MASLQTDRIRLATRERGTRKHHKLFPPNSCPDNFRFVIDWLVPPPASPADLVALFDGRASYGMIRHWKYERSKPPAWAVEIACQKLRAKIKPIQEALERAPRHIGPGLSGSGAAGTKALAAWRERKAREKNEMPSM